MKIKHLLLAGLACLSMNMLQAQVSITTLGSMYYQDFNTLDNATTGTGSSNLPNGWLIREFGANGNGLYKSETGSSNSGDVYSYGVAASTERALGSVASSNLQSSYLVRFVNNTASPVTSFTVSYTAEQWRSGGSRTTADSLFFSYGTNSGGSINAGLNTTAPWTRVTSLDGISKILGGAGGALVGDLPANQNLYQYTVTGVSIAPSDTLYLRWTDLNAAGNDDGLAIDSFTFTPLGAGGGPTVPSPVTALNFSALAQTTATLSWTKPAGYVDSTMTTLVFIKQGSAITQGTPSGLPAYTANTNFTTGGTAYQNDVLAKCVMSSDSAFVNITGLTPSTNYYALVYVIRNTDSVYSTAATANAGTLAVPAPGPVASPVFSNQAQTAIRLDWTKPAGYVDSTTTTLVFIKQASAVLFSAPTNGPSSYTANSNFSLAASAFQYDGSAKCVLNSDSTGVTITGLTANTVYHALILTVRNADSVYSTAVIANGSTLATATTPAAISGVLFTATAFTNATITWTKPGSYNNASHTTLIFVKEGAAITAGTPTLNPALYVANTNYTTGTARYQFDTAARCVYKGDSSSVNITGLKDGTVYHVLGIVVNDADSNYSTPAIANGTTPMLPPAPVTAVTFTGLSVSTAKAAWTKPAGYTNATWTTLVFVKAASAVTAGTPTRTVSYYTANAAFGSGTIYQNDPAARCVYKGDTNFVNITGMATLSAYHVLVLTVRDVDSSYSTPAAGNGLTLAPPPPPPYYTISQVNHTSLVTGVPDSNNVKATLRGVVYGFNQRLTGLQFLLRDNTGGITVLNSLSTPAYTVTEGDSIEVQGTISSTAGLVIITTLDSLKKTGTGKNIKTPVVVSQLNEASENDLIRLNGVKFVTPPTGSNWPSSASSNASFKALTQNNDTIMIRFVATSALAGTPLPSTPTFDIIGIGSQISSATVAPFPFNGYQVIPRKPSDIVPIIVPPADSLGAFTLSSPANASTVNIGGDSSQKLTIRWNGSKPAAGVSNPTYTWLVDTAAAGNFTTPVLSIPSDHAGNDTSLVLSYGQLRNVLNALGITPGQTLSTKWTVVARTGTYSRKADASFSLQLIVAPFTGIAEVVQQRITVYPNPAHQAIHVTAEQPVQSLSVSDLSGREVLHAAGTDHLDVSALSKGMYILKVQAGDANHIQRIIIE